MLINIPTIISPSCKSQPRSSRPLWNRGRGLVRWVEEHTQITDTKAGDNLVEGGEEQDLIKGNGVRLSGNFYSVISIFWLMGINNNSNTKSCGSNLYCFIFSLQNQNEHHFNTIAKTSQNSLPRVISIVSNIWEPDLASGLLLHQSCLSNGARGKERLRKCKPFVFQVLI